MITITAGGTALPSPTEMTLSGEIVWSANTGRAASGLMIGDVIAEKQTVGLRWGVLTKAELALLREKLVSGFFPATLAIDGQSVDLTCYRGALTAELLGTFGGTTYYRSAAATLIEQ